MEKRNFEFVKKFACQCGREHTTQVDDVIIENGAIRHLPNVVRRYGASKVFVLADKNTDSAAGERVSRVLKENGIAFSKYVYKADALEPDEHGVGSFVMNYDPHCNMIIAVGSGVINDIGKILAKITGHPYVIVATAPSMDGYASATSSMALNGLKVSLPSACANVIIGDIDILKDAPIHMLKSGLGDMIAKYISICEWRIAHIITGEYYCETIADMVRNALKKCVDNADGLLKRDEEAVQAVFEGLIIGGVAMGYAGVSRPASGVEHYFSHVWDMRALEFGTNMDLHGIQCAIGTLVSARLYEKIKKITPDRQKALDYARDFDVEQWNTQLREFLGKSALEMIALEKKEGKYNVQKHADRLEIILAKWNEILAIIDEELPSAAQIEELLTRIEAPKSVEEIGIDQNLVPMSFRATKDIRDKYVLSRLAWDLGIIEEL